MGQGRINPPNTQGEQPKRQWIAIRIVKLGTGRFSIEAETWQGRVALKGTDHGRHGALGMIDTLRDMMVRFIVGERQVEQIEARKS